VLNAAYKMQNKFLVLLLIVILYKFGCSVKPVEVAIITIKGSDSMLQLTENLAEEYMKLNPGISIYVYGGGTSEGVRALIRNEVDICTASRNLRPEEAKDLADYYGTVGLFYLVAKDALCVYINPNNPVKNLSTSQLKQIFECEIANWDELGGNFQKVKPVIRNINSGTHFYFKEHVLEGKEYCTEAIIEATEYFYKNSDDAFYAYNIFLRALEINPYSLSLLKAFTKHCVEIRLTDYARDALEDLEDLWPENYHKKFVEEIEKEISDIEKEISDWSNGLI